CDDDIDGDGLLNAVETNTGVYVGPNDTGTNPLLADSDSDGLSDGSEVNVYHTNPLLTDSDGDGFSDGLEVATGSLPTAPASTPAGVPALSHWQGLALAVLLLGLARRSIRHR